MKEHLTRANAGFETREIPSREFWQIFVRDPNGVMIELNYRVADEKF
jgi:hypothetical protein